MARLNRAFDRLLSGLEYLPGAIIGIIALAIGFDVLTRNFGFVGIRGLIEATEYGLFLLTFLGVASVMRRGGHVSVEIFVESLPAPLRKAATTLALVLNAVIALGLVWGAWLGGRNAWESNSHIYKNFVVAEWLLLAVVFLGATLLAIECLRQLVRNLVSGAAPTRLRPTEKIDV